jgi:glycerol-3-phosphate dehydrogenase
MNRDEMISRLEETDEIWDFIIIGGGATGIGTAIEGSSRGYKVLLLEQSDFLISHAARYLSKDPGRSDVLSAFAGLRPLVRQGDVKNCRRKMDDIP